MDRRRLLGWLAFFAFSGLVALGPELFEQHEESIVALGGRPGATPSGPGAAAAGHAGAWSLRGAPASRAVPRANLFAARSWRVAPAPRPRPAVVARAAVSAPPPPPPPAAPPLPFQFIGRLDDSVRLRVFLLRGERVHTVQAGDVIDGTYRLEKISADELTLVYLPLNQTQSLSVGEHP